MSCNSPLARWIYKRLIHRYRQASVTNSYHFMYSDLKGSGLLQQTIEGDNRKKALAALDELVSKGVLMSYEPKKRLEGRKIMDVKYTLFPSSDFSSEQKAANKRVNENQIKANEAGLQIVDKHK